MSLWQQNYDPAGNIWLSSLIASLPILFFFFALIKLKLKGYVAASWTVFIALAVALLFYKMPVDRALASVVYGFFYGLWPIAWIIIAAVFVYKISVKTGQFDIIRSSILSITPDQRLQMLIVGFSFGAFLEGAAGFGAPVAITAALLVATARSDSRLARGLRRRLVAAAVIDGLWHWWSAREPGSWPVDEPVGHVLLRRLDDLAYGLGLWRGAIGARPVSDLILGMSWLRTASIDSAIEPTLEGLVT